MDDDFRRPTGSSIPRLVSASRNDLPPFFDLARRRIPPNRLAFKFSGADILNWIEYIFGEDLSQPSLYLAYCNLIFWSAV